MTTFTIHDGDNDHDKYEKFIHLYNNSNLTIKEILNKLGLGNSRYKNFRKQAIHEGRLNQRENSLAKWRMNR